MRIARCFGILVVTALALSNRAWTQDQAVELKIVKYDGLKDVVRKHRGKVVLVDFWDVL